MFVRPARGADLVRPGVVGPWRLTQRRAAAYGAKEAISCYEAHGVLLPIRESVAIPSEHNLGMPPLNEDVREVDGRS
jgi:hypothetical protein